MPPVANKPVKVYILAGQSNMVGMGTISGARCRYTGIYLTADPNAPKGPQGPYDPTIDYDKAKPAKTETSRWELCRERFRPCRARTPMSCEGSWT